jgi:hypothetical protein
MLLSSWVMLLYMMMSQLLHANVIPDMSTVDVMLTSSLSESVTWVGSAGIWVGSTHPGEEDAWGASAHVGKCLAGE